MTKLNVVKIYMYKYFCFIFLFSIQPALSQRVGFVSSEMIREKFPEAQGAEQRIQSNVDEWKRQLKDFDVNIANTELEIKQNRLIWTDTEKLKAESKLAQLKTEKKRYAEKHFEPGGEYDKFVQSIWAPIETKIYAAINEVAAEEKFDFVFDKSQQPVPYTNYKYDLTLKVLRKLGVDTEEMEAELKKKIDKDPRNLVKESKKRPSRRSRSRRSRSRTPQTDEKTKQEQELLEENSLIDKKENDETELPPNEDPGGRNRGEEEEEEEEGGEGKN